MVVVVGYHHNHRQYFCHGNTTTTTTDSTHFCHCREYSDGEDDHCNILDYRSSGGNTYLISSSDCYCCNLDIIVTVDSSRCYFYSSHTTIPNLCCYVHNLNNRQEDMILSYDCSANHRDTAYHSRCKAINTHY